MRDPFRTILLASVLIPWQAVSSPAALDAALKRVQMNPTDLEASFELSLVAAQTGDFRTAISALERILIANPALSNIKLELGVLYLRTGQTLLGERYIEEAIGDPSAPPVVKARAGELLTVARQRNEGRYSFGQARLTFGAHSNPLEAEGGSDADVSVAGSISGTFRKDLGFQAGHAFVFSASAYARRYADTSSENTESISFSTGVDLVFEEWANNPMMLALRLNGALIGKDGEHFKSDLGLSAEARIATEGRFTPNFRFSITEQTFEATAAEMANPDKSGTLVTAGFGGTLALEEGRALIFGIEGGRRNSAEDFESYKEIFGSVSYVMPVQPLFEVGAAEGPWIASFNLSAAHRNYDTLRPALVGLESGPREDTTFKIGASLEVPLTESAAAIGAVDYTDVSSSHTGQSSKNTVFSLTVAKRF